MRQDWKEGPEKFQHNFVEVWIQSLLRLHVEAILLPLFLVPEDQILLNPIFI